MAQLQNLQTTDKPAKSPCWQSRGFFASNRALAPVLREQFAIIFIAINKYPWVHKAGNLRALTSVLFAKNQIFLAAGESPALLRGLMASDSLGEQKRQSISSHEKRGAKSFSALPQYGV